VCRQRRTNKQHCKRKIKPKAIPTERADRFFIVNACFLRRSLSLLERYTDPEGNSFELISLTSADRSASLFDDMIDDSITSLIEMPCSVSITESLTPSD